MAKKNPGSAEWHARCLDVVAAISDGSQETDCKSGWTLFITVPPYADMEAGAAAYNAKATSVVKSMFPDAKEVLAMDTVKGAPAARQYVVSGEGTFRELEDAIMSGSGALQSIFGESTGKFIDKLELNRPTVSQDTTPGQIADRLAGVIGEDRLHAMPALEFAIKKAQSAPYDIALLNSLKGLKSVISEQFKDSAVDAAVDNAADALTAYRNAVRLRMENWMGKAFAGLAAPYMAPVFKNAANGEQVQFRDAEDFAGRLASRIMSDDFDRAPKMALEQTGVLNTKVFPVSPYRTRSTAPSVYAKGDTATIKLNWQHARLNWNLMATLIKRIMQEYPEAVLKDSKKYMNNRYTDTFGFETINNQTITIKFKDTKQAALVADNMGMLLNRLYASDKKPLSGKYEVLENTAVALRDIADTWTAKTKRDNDIRKAEREQMCITNRIVPYANKSAIFIQGVGNKFPEYLKTAVKETLEQHPEWTLRASPEFPGAAYVSMHLNSSFTSEAAGLAARYMVANEIADKAAAIEPNSLFRVLPPDNGFTIEVYTRRTNPKDKNDNSEGLYVKFPAVFQSGGALEEASIEDEDFTEKLPSVCKAFYDFGEEFGRNAANKSMLKLFIPASSAMEAYTKTWMYKFKDTDNKEEKIGKLKELINERIDTLFGGNSVLVNLDWMPNREERKTADINYEIHNFMLNKWTPNQMQAEAVKAPDTSEADYEL